MQASQLTSDRLVYTQDQAYQAALSYFKGDDLAARVWVNKYALKDSEGRVYEQTPDDMHQRLAAEIARVEQKYPNPLSQSDVFALIKNFTYLVPQGGPMTGIGNPHQIASLSNCFVIGNPGESDSYGGIMKIDQEQVQLMKRRGGVGHDLSHVRPRGSAVKNSALTSTGIVPFMERYSNSTREVAQDGRRGALMLSVAINHPDAEDFIDAKMEQGKVTGANVSVRIDDKFMQAVRDNTDYQQSYPVFSDNPAFTKKTDASKLWQKIIHNAWKSAEPGILFWDTITRESIPDCYADLGYKTVSTNPCVTGDTLVAVADGRGSVSIKELADAGDDVPVYCYDKNEKVAIRHMRNPRVTGRKVPIYKVTLEDGWTERVTGNHKFKLKSGEYKQADELVTGDSLQIMSISEAPIVWGETARKNEYIWVNGGRGKKSEHRLIWEFHNNVKIELGDVIHHIDYDSKNNHISNLQKMTKVEHDISHTKDMLGDKNPYYTMSDAWKKEFSKSNGELNGRYSGYTENDLRNAALTLTTKLGRRFSKMEWQEYATKKGMPQNFSGWRTKQLNGTITALSKWAAKEIGLDEYINVDPRLVKTYHTMLDSGYDAEIVGNQVIITKQCECCGTEIKHEHRNREMALCSITCHNKLMHSNPIIKDKITATRTKTENVCKNRVANKQVKVYSDLKFKLDRMPMLKEWVTECKSLNISTEIGRTSSPIRNFTKLKELASEYNHKVVSVEPDGFEDVYNGTVDEFHNFFIGGFDTKTQNGKRKTLYVNNLNCGEIPLCPYDSCRLLAINLFSYVNNPFTDKAEFDQDLFIDHVAKAQRLMDDIIDLELEKIEAILTKIDADPESEEVKRIEKNLWVNIKQKAEEGRRTGIGITAEGDMLAALGIRYGSQEGNDFSEQIHKTIAIETYRASVDMAKERGAFGIYDSEREQDNPFIQRLKNADASLYKDMVKYGRRNIALLTIAPTGTTSLMTQTSSGIEPVFLPVYKRRRKVNPNDKDARIDFVDEVGDSWEEYIVFHQRFKQWMKINGYDTDKIYSDKEIKKLVKQSPYHQATSNDVDWLSKVRMQGAVQKWVDHSISVTINLPQDVSEKLVGELYTEAWKVGCKGVTVYRDGSRSGVLISNEEKPEELVAFPTKRPKTLDAEVVRFHNNKEKWIAFVSTIKGKPYEIFTGLADDEDGIFLPRTVDSGHIIKSRLEDGSSRYDFQFTNKRGYKTTIEGLSHKFNPEYWNYAKLISSTLRHGMPIEKVVELINTLQLDSESINTWKNGVTRALKRYIADGTEVEKGTCENCQSTDLIYQEGCLTCKSCGSSKCG